MTYDIEREIARFERFGTQTFPHHRIERLGEYGWLLTPYSSAETTPAQAQVKALNGKDIALTLTGIVHGNEWAGAAVLNATLAHLASGAVLAPLTLAFVLGNPWAAKQNRRFLERDLNRSFGREAPPTTHEERRAKALEAILQRTAYILDFHQTMRRSERPFFIFPHTHASFEWARQMAPRISVITHWGKPFSAEGRCTDEYVNICGGIGVTAELGQNGFDPYQIAVGTDLALASIASVTARLSPTRGLNSVYQVDAFEEGEIFTWAEIVPWPTEGLVELRSDWHNFKTLRAGETLGTVDGKPLVASVAGRMLFPKYLTHDEQKALTSRPTELCRIMKTVTKAEIMALPASTTLKT